MQQTAGRCRSARDAGFTLVEVSVVLLISAVVGAILVAVVASIGKAWLFSAELAGHERSAREAVERISKDVANAASPNLDLVSVEDRWAFKELGPTHLGFVALDRDTDSMNYVRFWLKGSELRRAQVPMSRAVDGTWVLPAEYPDYAQLATFDWDAAGYQ